MTTPMNKYSPKFTNPAQESKALVMLAAGCTAIEVAAALGAHPQTIRALAKKPGNAEYIAGLRQRIKVESTGVLHRTQPKLASRLEKAVDDPATPAKDLDALSRALMNTEKTSASMAGENRPVPAGPMEVVVTFPSWAPPIQAQTIESQAATLALPAGGEEAELEPGIEPEKDKYEP